MNTRRQIHLKYAAYTLCLASLFTTYIPVVQAEEAILLRSTDATIINSLEMPRSFQRETLLKLDEKGNLLFVCRNARFTVSCNSTAVPDNSSCMYETRRVSNVPTIGVSLSVSLAF